MPDPLRMKPLVANKARTVAEIKRRLEALADRMTRNADEPTWECATCGDGLGYVVRIDAKGIAWATPCIDCATGQRIIAGDVKRRERRQQREKREAVAAAARGEDLPI